MQLLSVRLIIGICQGSLLLLLSRNASGFGAGACPVVTCVSLAMILGLTTIRQRTLVVYLPCLSAVLGLVQWHVQATHAIVLDPDTLILSRFSTLNIASVYGTYLFAFLAQALVTAGDSEDRLFATYPRYFDASWKLAVQIFLAGLFTGAFWLILLLGVGLFSLLGLTFFASVISNPVFAWISTSTVMAGALHVTDVRPAIIRGIRTLKLTLFSWLLPVAVVIAAGFLAALVIKGFPSLRVHDLTADTLIGMGFLLVYLINAAYQDGAVEQATAPVLRVSGSLGSALILAFAGLAAFRLGLRMNEDGFSTNRILAMAAIVQLSCYGLGYVIALFRSRTWLKQLEPTNVTAALLFMVLYILIFSPIADPARLTVRDQVARLHTGKISPDNFDFAYLTHSLGSYGNRAMDRLKDDPDAHIASAAMAFTGQHAGVAKASPVSADDMQKAVTVYPPDQTIPPSFWQQDWNDQKFWALRACPSQQTHCEAFVIDLEHNGVPDILLSSGPNAALNVFSERADHTWDIIGFINLPYCANNKARAALEEGKVSLSSPSQVSGLSLGGKRFPFVEKTAPFDCK